MSSVKKAKFQTIDEPNAEMTDFLSQFPESDTNIGEQIARLENDICAIRSSLEKKVKKITMAQLNIKIDYIISALHQSGITYSDDNLNAH